MEVSNVLKYFMLTKQSANCPDLGNIIFRTYSREFFEDLFSFFCSDDCDEILMPDYMCSTVVNLANRYGVVKFYSINEHLKCCESEVLSIVSQSTKIFISVDYFGVETIYSKGFLRRLREASPSILLVKDSAHSYLSLQSNDFSNINGFDFTVASLYKSIPTFIGAIVVTSSNLCGFVSQVRYAELLITLIRYNVKQTVFFLKLFSLIPLPPNSTTEYIPRKKGVSDGGILKKLISHVDTSKIISHNRSLSAIIYDSLCGSIYQPCFSLDEVNSNVLTSFPIYVSDNVLLSKLFKFALSRGVKVKNWPILGAQNQSNFLKRHILLLPLTTKSLEVIQQFHKLNYGSMFLYVKNKYNPFPLYSVDKNDRKKVFVKYMNAYIFELPASLEQLRHVHKKKYWYNLRRAEDQFVNLYSLLEFKYLTNVDDILSYLDRVRELFISRWRGQRAVNLWLNDTDFEQYKVALLDLCVSGQASLAVLSCGENVLAFSYNLISSDCLYLYQHCASNIPEYRKYSLGKIFLAKLIQYLVLNTSLKYLDFMVGDYAYKKEWANNVVPVYRVLTVDKKPIKLLKLCFNILYLRMMRWVRTNKKLYTIIKKITEASGV